MKLALKSKPWSELFPPPQERRARKPRPATVSAKCSRKSHGQCSKLNCLCQCHKVMQDVIKWHWECRCGLQGTIDCPPVKNHLGALTMYIMSKHPVPHDIVPGLYLKRVTNLITKENPR